ncbi:Furin-like protease 2 [Armadillidium vulgare]|nr:Furin-like protease 2 [Armadillidium vulgare]
MSPALTDVQMECSGIKIDEYFENGKCLECHRSCLNCFGPKNNECLSCKRPLFLLNHKCVDSCPEGYYSYQNNCFRCQHGCSSCTSYDECTACEEKYFLHQNKCLSSCPQGYYNNNDNRSCTTCNSACKSCEGPQADHCLSCPDNLILLQNFCSSGCPSGYYEEDSRCRPCYHNCKTCNASGIFSCTSCQPYLTLDGGMCLECPSGQYYNISQAKCDHCHESCLTCKGSHFNQCLSCQAPYSLHQETGTCQTCCKESTDEAKNGDCCECLPETGNFNSKSSARGTDSYNYQPLLTQASSSNNFNSCYKNSAQVSTLTFRNEDIEEEEEEDDDEAKELIKFVTNT